MRHRDFSAFFTPRGFGLSLTDGSRGWGLHAMLAGAKEVVPLGEREQSARVHHYVGQASKWRRDLPTYGQIAWEEIYPGIDMVVEPARGGFAYWFLVSPGADPSKIALEWSGSVGVHADAEGRDVRLETGIGDLHLAGLRAFELEGDERRFVRARHAVDGSTVRVVVSGWTGARFLVIDPTVTWAKLLGGSKMDASDAIASDSAGNVAFAGRTGSSDFPATGGFDASLGGSSDAVVAKLTSSGTLVWSSYLGGSGTDVALGVGADPAGNVVVGGLTLSTDFPLLSAFDATSSAAEGFVTKLSSSGGVLWSSFLGGTEIDVVSGVATDATGDVFVTGTTWSSDFAAAGGFDSTFGGVEDAFITKISSAGAILWSSYLGGAGDEQAFAIACDGSGNPAVTGTLTKGLESFPVTPGLEAEGRVFVAKASAAGGLLWARKLKDTEEGEAIASDAAGNVYAAGSTCSPSMPALGGFDTSYSAGCRSFVAKLGTTGTLIWASYLGAPYGTAVRGAASDVNGNVLLTGSVYSATFPTKGAFDSTLSSIDGFIVKVGPTGSLLWSSYLGGSAVDYGAAIATDPKGNIFVAGATSSTDFPETSSGSGWEDAFVFVKPQHANGEACKLGSDCMTGECVDGVCCDLPCSGKCQACTAAKKGAGVDGACGPIADGLDPDKECAAGACASAATLSKPHVCNGLGACRADGDAACHPYVCKAAACLASCTTDADCASATHFCESSKCTPRRAAGAACSAARECASGHCVDGVCCDKACTGPCEACSAAKKGSGSDGTCAPVAADTDPKDACASDPGFPTSCKADGMCDGAGACRVYAKVGASCGATVCGGTTISGPSCDGAGTCDPKPKSCGAYRCDPDGKACRTSCASSTECAPGAYCTKSGTCRSTKSHGETCEGPGECTSGRCIDHVCCATICAGQCEACDVKGSEGTCVAVSGAPRGDRAACAGDISACGGTCDGVNRTACAYEPPTKRCGGVCADGRATARVCDGKGACVDGASTACAPFACTGDRCASACSSDAECANGFGCVANECVRVAAQEPDPSTGCSCRVLPRRGGDGAALLALAALGVVRRRVRS